MKHPPSFLDFIFSKKSEAEQINILKQLISKDTTQMKIYEYKVDSVTWPSMEEHGLVNFRDGLEKESAYLNHMGEASWELIYVKEHGQYRAVTYYFKREMEKLPSRK